MQITVVQGDLLAQPDLDYIVNAANTHLEHMGGIAGAISRAAGPRLQAESRSVRPVPTGGAVATTAGKLPYRAVIHAVGPIWGGGTYDEARLLHLAVRNALVVADDLGRAHGRQVKVGLPAISCGIFGYPVRQAAPVIVGALRGVTRPNITEARIVVMDETHHSAFTDAALSGVRG